MMKKHILPVLLLCSANAFAADPTGPLEDLFNSPQGSEVAMGFFRCSAVLGAAAMTLPEGPQKQTTLDLATFYFDQFMGTKVDQGADFRREMAKQATTLAERYASMLESDEGKRSFRADANYCFSWVQQAKPAQQAKQARTKK